MADKRRGEDPFITLAAPVSLGKLKENTHIPLQVSLCAIEVEYFYG